jgi:hypothetical protein
MTAGVLDRPVTGQFDLDGGGTLEELLSSALSEAHTNGSTECPVCHARMISTRARGGGAAPGAECSGCGSRLS